MFVTKIKIADLIIQMECTYSYTEKMCKEYVVDSPNVDFIVSVAQEEVQVEKSKNKEEYPAGYLESICIYRKISEKLYGYNAFLMHAAIVAVDDQAFAFAAKSGTGKTTHISLWLEQFKERAMVINGDKPILRFKGDKNLYAYGTPWCGKEHMHVNKSAPLRAIAFIERNEENLIERLDSRQVMDRLFHQILLPKNVLDMNLFLEMLDKMIQMIPCYLLRCNMNKEAALVAYQAMSR